MKVTCLQENLARGLGIVGRAVALRSTLPITSNVLISTEHGRIKLAATNLDIALSCWIGGQIEDEGAITVPARLLHGLRELAARREDRPDARAALQAAQARSARATRRRSAAWTPTTSRRSRPSRATRFELDAKMLREAITQVVFSAATDDSRPVLTGVDLVVEGDTLTLAAADGFRLAVRTLKLKKKVAEKQEVIVPAKALAELNRLLQDQEEPVADDVQRQQDAGAVPAQGRRAGRAAHPGHVPGLQPPHPEGVEQPRRRRGARLPAGDEDRLDLRARRQRHRPHHVRGRRGRRARPDDRLRARRGDRRQRRASSTRRSRARHRRSPSTARYLQDVLQVLDGGRVALETTGPSQPGVIRPIDNDNYVHVVMPMFVQW